MTDPERKLAGPLSDKIPTGTDDWGPAPLSQSDQIELRIRVDPDALEEMSEQVESFGGSIKASYGRTIEATFPAGKVTDLAEIDAIRNISEEIDKQEFKRTVSEGLEITNTDDIQNEGLTGSTSKVAIIDFYFDPSNPKFGDNVVGQIGSSDGFVSQDGQHGTGCAEVVYDMAPDADLVLGSIAGSNDTLVSILNDIESQHPDTDVVSISLGSPPIDRMDGLDDESLEIASFTDGGRLAAISAGNEADGDTWHGPYQDSAGNSLMEFDGSGTEYLKVNSPAASSYIIANWDDWGDMNNLDYTLRIYEDQSKSTLIDEDGPSTEPWAAVQFSDSPPSEAYIEIEKGSGADGNQEFDIWIWGEGPYMEIPEHTRSRSMSIPATNQDDNTLAVAAIQATSKGVEPEGGDLKSYSSQGPTRDGRQGIDVAGPSRVSQTDNGYGSLDDWNPPNTVTGFNGTSAAAPHIAGIAGALFDVDGVTNEDVRSALESTGTEISDSDMGTVSPPNTKIGGGYVDALAASESFSFSEPLSTKWTSNDLGGDAQYNTPVVDSSQVYVGGLQKAFYALSRDDGESVGWTVDRGNKPGLSDSSAHIWTDPSQNKVFFGSGQGKVYAVAADDATEHWSGGDIPDLGSAVTSTPTSDNGIIYAGTNDGRVLAWDASTAAQQWEVSVDGPVYSELAADSGLVYVTTANGTLHVLDGSDGTEQWKDDSFADFGASSPALANGNVYVVADEGYVFEAASRKGQLGATSGFGGTAGSDPVVDSGTIYAGSADGNLYAYDDSDGSELWTFSTGGPIAATPAVNDAGSRIAVASTDGTLYLLDSTGTEQDTVSIPADTRASPVIDSGVLFLPTASGVVYAFE